MLKGMKNNWIIIWIGKFWNVRNLIAWMNVFQDNLIYYVYIFAKDGVKSIDDI